MAKVARTQSALSLPSDSGVTPWLDELKDCNGIMLSIELTMEKASDRKAGEDVLKYHQLLIVFINLAAANLWREMRQRRSAVG